MNHLQHLPNQEGFVFIGVDKDGNRHECEVKKNPVGCHSVYKTETGEPFFFRLSGWERKNAKA